MEFESKENKIKNNFKFSLLNALKTLTRPFKLFCQVLFFNLFSFVPKKKNLWIFSGYRKKSYMDNTKYLYEYVVKNHPEIKAFWLTRDKTVKKKLKELNMPVLNMNSPLGIWMGVRAGLAIFDHFKMTDFSPKYGINAKTKFVNLWHGIGYKSFIPENDVVPYTTIPGVRLSSDILVNDRDNLINMFIKKIKYFFTAPFRELFEEYFAILCPSETFIASFANPLKIPKKSQILCGYPRNITTYENIGFKNGSYKILYAPTFRWRQSDEENMINMLINSLNEINLLLEKINAEFVLRLHPHTWRNYEDKILDYIKQYPKISISTEKDICSELYKYSLLITDYSSISSDFLITLKPVIYFPFDIETYNQTDCKFCIPYKENCAGRICYSWKETLKTIEMYKNNPNYDRELRENILQKFFPEEYNGINNSERIVNELKKRIEGA